MNKQEQRKATALEGIKNIDSEIITQDWGYIFTKLVRNRLLVLGIPNALSNQIVSELKLSMPEVFKSDNEFRDNLSNQISLLIYKIYKTLEKDNMEFYIIDLIKQLELSI